MSAAEVKQKIQHALGEKAGFMRFETCVGHFHNGAGRCFVTLDIGPELVDLDDKTHLVYATQKTTYKDIKSEADQIIKSAGLSLVGLRVNPMREKGCLFKFLLSP